MQNLAEILVEVMEKAEAQVEIITHRNRLYAFGVCQALVDGVFRDAPREGRVTAAQALARLTRPDDLDLPEVQALYSHIANQAMPKASLFQSDWLMEPFSNGREPAVTPAVLLVTLHVANVVEKAFRSEGFGNSTHVDFVQSTPDAAGNIECILAVYHGDHTHPLGTLRVSAPRYVCGRMVCDWTLSVPHGPVGEAATYSTDWGVESYAEALAVSLKPETPEEDDGEDAPTSYDDVERRDNSTQS